MCKTFPGTYQVRNAQQCSILVCHMIICTSCRKHHLPLRIMWSWSREGAGLSCSRGPDLPVSAVRLSSCGAPHRCRKWFSQKTPPSALRTRRATSFSIKPVVIPINNKSSYYIGVFWYLTLDKTIFYTRILIKSALMVKPWNIYVLTIFMNIKLIIFS